MLLRSLVPRRQLYAVLALEPVDVCARIWHILILNAESVLESNWFVELFVGFFFFFFFTLFFSRKWLTMPGQGVYFTMP